MIPNEITVHSAEVWPVAGHSDADRSTSEGTRRRILEAVPASTNRAYARQWAAFADWCDGQGRVARC
jgi:hypothetical protein